MDLAADAAVVGRDRANAAEAAPKSSSTVSTAAPTESTRDLRLPSGSAMTSRFPDAFAPYWIRFTASDDTTATATLNDN